MDDVLTSTKCIKVQGNRVLFEEGLSKHRSRKGIISEALKNHTKSRTYSLVGNQSRNVFDNLPKRTC